MGLGDNIMATGMAKGAAARGKRIAFGDGEKIIWDYFSKQIYFNNDNIAAPGSELATDLEWIPFHRGNRIYNTHDHANDKWIWNYDFKAIPGEIFFTAEELAFAHGVGKGAIIIEPNLPPLKYSSPNKQWAFQDYDKVARYLVKNGYNVLQFYYGAGHKIPFAKQIKTKTFRQALAVLKNSRLYIGPEGGMHHGAAAVGVEAVVLFGGFIPPQVTGYDFHTNITGGAEACGSLHRCIHCMAAMQAIKVDDVFNAAIARLRGGNGGP